MSVSRYIFFVVEQVKTKDTKMDEIGQHIFQLSWYEKGCRVFYFTTIHYIYLIHEKCTIKSTLVHQIPYSLHKCKRYLKSTLV
jgi:hypothetical protein